MTARDALDFDPIVDSINAAYARADLAGDDLRKTAFLYLLAQTIKCRKIVKAEERDLPQYEPGELG